jgi:hypothetical protein
MSDMLLQLVETRSMLNTQCDGVSTTLRVAGRCTAWYSVPFAVADGQDSRSATPASVSSLSLGHPLPRTVLNTAGQLLATPRGGTASFDRHSNHLRCRIEFVTTREVFITRRENQTEPVTFKPWKYVKMYVKDFLSGRFTIC